MTYFIDLLNNWLSKFSTYKLVDLREYAPRKEVEEIFNNNKEHEEKVAKEVKEHVEQRLIELERICLDMPIHKSASDLEVVRIRDQVKQNLISLTRLRPE